MFVFILLSLSEAYGISFWNLPNCFQDLIIGTSFYMERTCLYRSVCLQPNKHTGRFMNEVIHALLTEHWPLASARSAVLCCVEHLLIGSLWWMCHMTLTNVSYLCDQSLHARIGPVVQIMPIIQCMGAPDTVMLSKLLAHQNIFMYAALSFLKRKRDRLIINK